ncbi:ribonuclease H-like domain-containing protein [Coprinopsis sp. MPI-PUGE-AT-0042]|nr:ribonuclease H-like domain-containing protein [Coprinopsis sp. MPI-PUGE-AT-0042]
MSPAGPSSNWQKLQQKIKKPGSTSSKEKRGHGHKHKRPRTGTSTTADGQSLRSSSPAPSVATTASQSNRYVVPTSSVASVVSGKGKPEDKASLQAMILGHLELGEKQKLPGKYLSLDCEMVGVGLDGTESSLARVSLVNFYGGVVLDEFVRQRERVVDYRTQWSGVRESDMVHAKPFLEVQKQVADLIKDKILVGHAVYNDLKALLLSHPYPLTRDTQVLAYKSSLVKTRRVALRNLVKDEVGLTIQGGEHSSVTDARATMAVYRLHKKEWDKIVGHVPHSLHVVSGAAPTMEDAANATSSSSDAKGTKRKRVEPDVDGDDKDGDEDALGSDENEEAKDGEDSPVAAPASNGKPTPLKRKSKSKNPSDPGQGRKGVSSGLSTVVRHKGGATSINGRKGKQAQQKDLGKASKSSGSGGEWWKELPGAVGGKKGSMKL